jgi:hypothetical protein
MKVHKHLAEAIFLLVLVLIVETTSACGSTKPVTPAGKIEKSVTDELLKESKALMPVIAEFQGDPYRVFPAENVTLSWRVRQADTVSIDNGLGDVQASGSMRLAPSATTTYTIKAVNRYGEVSKSAQVVVMNEDQPPGIFLEVSPASLQTGKMARLEWNTSAAREVSIDNGVGSRQVSGAILVKPLTTTTYTLTAVNKAGRSSKSVTVEIVQAGN